MKQLITAIMVVTSFIASAQDSIPITFSGYAEGYYSYDFNKPSDNNRPYFLYSHNRHNEFNVNLAFVKASYNTQRIRANVAIAAGTYINANYAAEPGVLKNIFEANVGYKISNNKNLWLDVGIMPSHIGFESAIGKDNWTLTRSLVAENSPYFESGAKLSYTSPNGKLQLAALALNGWQRITRLSGNSLMSWGMQVYARPSDKITLNYSTFFGTDKPDSARVIRTYHNLYGIFQLTDKLGLTLGLDIGTERNTWYIPIAILRFTPDPKWAVALRGEYFSDQNSIIVSTGKPNGFKTAGLSVNIDYLPMQNAMLRLEARHLNSKDEIFSGKNDNSNTAITFSLAVGFN